MKWERRQDPGTEVRLQGQRQVSIKFDLDLSSLRQVPIISWTQHGDFIDLICKA